MKKKSLIIILVLLVILIPCIYYFLKTDVLSETSTSVTELDTTVDIDDSDESINWDSYSSSEKEVTESISITSEGVYTLTGTITDGMITINTDGDVKLILDNLIVTNTSGPAIYVESANTVVISTLSGTTNTLKDSNSYSGYDDEVEGAIYSKDDLVLEGDGTLVVIGNKGDAIVCKDDLKINSGTYKITSSDDGIRGTDSVYILDGTFTVDAGGDGIKSTNTTDSSKGYVKIDAGTFTIDADLDGLQAETKIIISGGTFDIATGGGSSNASTSSSWGSWGQTSSDSAKGIKAGSNIIITGGTFTLNTSDDSVHSNDAVGISGGTFTISSGDDGIHADSELVIDAGNITIKKSYEGLEAQTITINDGTISLVSSDDGINAAGGSDGSGTNRPGNETASSSKSTLTINGGTIYIDASGDGLDANGSIYITGGNITVDGPTSSENAALDYDSECKITGGTLIALGSSGMAENISSSSTQYGVLINFESNYSSGTKVSITDSSGNEIMSYTSSKTFSSLVYSSSSLSTGTYKVLINGSEYTSFKVSSITTTVGSGNMMNGNGGNGRMMR